MSSRITVLIAVLLFAGGLQAHELKVKLPGLGDPPVPREIAILHFHECVKQKVPVPQRPGIETIVFRHHKPMTSVQVGSLTAVAATWIEAHGDGNVLRASPPTSSKNCHGVTFDGGNSWIEQPQPFVDRCKKWKPPPKEPPIGTVVIYRKGDRIAHSGRVIATPSGKSEVWVHSQWGLWGNFDHRVDAVPEIYGTPTYYTCP